MIIKLHIEINENVEKTKYRIDRDFGCDYILKIKTNSKNGFNELISDKKSNINAIKEYNKMSLDYNKECPDIIDISLANSIEELIDSISFSARNSLMDKNGIDYITINTLSRRAENKAIWDYLEKHKEFKDKTIIANEIISVNTNVDRLIKKYKDYKKVLFISDDCVGYITIEEARNGKYLKDFIKKVKKLDLSPLETALFVYDFVREKPYLLEDESEDVKESRNIYSVLNNNNIVCAGYSRLYESIMNSLGINCCVLDLMSETYDIGHERNIIKIDDEKYNVHGIFYVDATVDNRCENDIHNFWLYNYDGFMKKQEYFDKLDAKYNYSKQQLHFLDDHKLTDIEYIKNCLSYSISDMFKVFGNNMAESNKYNIEQMKVRDCLLHFIEYYYDDIYFDYEHPELLFDKYMELSDRIITDYNAKLNLSTFMRALIKVRYIENQIDPIKYPFDPVTIFSYTPTYRFDELNEREFLNDYLKQIDTFSKMYGLKVERTKPLNKNERFELLKCAYKNLCNKEAAINQKCTRVVDKRIKLYHYNKKDSI